MGSTQQQVQVKEEGVTRSALKKKISKSDPKKNVKLATAKDGSKKRKAKKVESYSYYIFKMLRIADPEGTISSKAMSIMNSFSNDMFERIATEAARLAKIRKSKTLSARDIECATKLLLPATIARHAVAEGIKAVARYSRSKE